MLPWWFVVFNMFVVLLSLRLLIVNLWPVLSYVCCVYY